MPKLNKLYYKYSEVIFNKQLPLVFQVLKGAVICEASSDRTPGGEAAECVCQYRDDGTERAIWTEV